MFIFLGYLTMEEMQALVGGSPVPVDRERMKKLAMKVQLVRSYQNKFQILFM